VLFQGNRVVTSDEVADAVIDYARALSGSGLHEMIHIPVVIDGALADCTITFGPDVAWAAISVPGTAPNGFSGSAGTAEQLRERTVRLLDASSGFVFTRL
jgi:hypothetical protein